MNNIRLKFWLWAYNRTEHLWHWIYYKKLRKPYGQLPDLPRPSPLVYSSHLAWRDMDFSNMLGLLGLSTPESIELAIKSFVHKTKEGGEIDGKGNGIQDSSKGGTEERG